MRTDREAPAGAGQPPEAKSSLQSTADIAGNPAYGADWQNHEGDGFAGLMVCPKPQSLVCYTVIDD